MDGLKDGPCPTDVIEIATDLGERLKRLKKAPRSSPLTYADIVVKVLDGRVRVEIEGVARTGSRRELFIASLVARAAAGDRSAVAQVLRVLPKLRPPFDPSRQPRKIFPIRPGGLPS